MKLSLWLGSLAGMTGALGRPESLSSGMLVGAGVVSAQVLGTWTVGRGAGTVIPSRAGMRARPGRPVPTDPVPDDPAHIDPVPAARHPLGPALLAAFWVAQLPLLASP